jgi:hypothetical protein
MSLNLGIIASSRQQGPQLLLDAYPGAAAAYSLRKLRNSYTGNCLQVRRNTDGALLNIGFVNNVLDTATLQTFIGVNTGLVTIWYDQSGNGNNAIPQSINNAPIIIQSGVLFTDGGKVAIAGGAEHMNISGITGNTSYAGYAVMSRTTSTAFLMSFTSSFVPVISLAYNNGILYNNNGVQDSFYSFTLTGRFLFSTLNISNSQSIYRNNVLIPVTSVSFSGSNVFNRILGRGATEPFQGLTQEQIFYNTNQAANNTGINTNINSFYSIYPVPPVVSDPDAQAFVDRVFAAGGSVTSTEANAVNTLTIGLKASGIWSLMKVIYPFVGASAASCAQNLKSSSFTGTFVNPWTFTSAGIQQFGTSHMNTNFNNQANWTSTSNGSMGFVSATNETGTTVVDMGVSPNLLNLNDASAICANYNGTYFAAINCTSIVPGVANPSTIGFFVTSRLNSSTFSKYKRGSSTINLTNTDPIGANTNTSIYLSAGNQANNALFFSKKLYNFCFIGDGLTQTQVDDYWTLLQTFNSSLGR